MPLSNADWPPRTAPQDLAILCSGGADSAILLGESLRAYRRVFPIYVRVGSYWEATEEAYLRRFLATFTAPALQPLTILSQPVADLYGRHWSLDGNGVPELGAPDEDSYLPGRNVLLFAKPLLWCLSRGISELATAPLASNPFPDATPVFYDSLAHVVGMSVGKSVRIVRPYADLGLHKADVLRRGREFPLELTFSCASPDNGLHCGRCSKCGERNAGFRAAGIPDPTSYAVPLPEVSHE